MKQIINIDRDGGGRLDKFLTSRFSNYSRSQLQKLIERGNVTVNSKPTKPNYILRVGDSIRIDFPENRTSQLIPEKINLEIIFENDDVVAINKQPGLVVHPASGNLSGTLVHALIERYPNIKDAVHDKTLELSNSRPGIVHRLDKDTSGVILVAKNKRALTSLSKQIKNRTVKKKYWAICFGWPKNDRGELFNFLGRHPKNRKVVADIGRNKGREAISNYKVLKYFEDNNKNKFSLIEFDIKTGRTHQIRYQSAQMSNPVMGDLVYGNKISIKISKKYGIARHLLHAKEIWFYLPGETKLTHLETDLPKDMAELMHKL